MKKDFLLLVTALTAATVALVSCNQDENIEIPSTNRTKVEFTSNIVAETPALRVAGNEWNANDPIGIYMFEQGSPTVVEGKENVQYVTVAGGQTGSFTEKDDIIYFPDNGSKVQFMSYYPYKDEVVSNGNVYKVDVSSQGSQSAIDLLYSYDKDAAYDKTVPGKKVSLHFEHQLTKIMINVEAGIGLVNDDLANIKVYFSGLSPKADFNLITGSFSNHAETTNITPLSIAVKDDYAASYEAIVLPTAAVPENAQIVFDLNNGEEGIDSDVFVWNFNTALSNATKYTYNVRVNRSGIVVEATIKDWINVDEESIDAE